MAKTVGDGGATSIVVGLVESVALHRVADQRSATRIKNATMLAKMMRSLRTACRLLARRSLMCVLADAGFVPRLLQNRKNGKEILCERMREIGIDNVDERFILSTIIKFE